VGSFGGCEILERVGFEFVEEGRFSGVVEAEEEDCAGFLVEAEGLEEGQEEILQCVDD